MCYRNIIYEIRKHATACMWRPIYMFLSKTWPDKKRAVKYTELSASLSLTTAH